MIHFQCIWKYLYVIIFQSSFLSAHFYKINYNLNSLKISDLPREKDLSKYLKTVNLVTTYCSLNTNKIDINLAFGIFLANVNFKHVLKYNEANLPNIIRLKLKDIILNNEEALNFFQKVMMDENNLMKDKQISKLFMNISGWVDRLEGLVNKRQKFYNLKHLENIYSQWKYYLEDVNNVEKWIPSPELSDMCLVSLAVNPIDDNDSHQQCSIADTCYSMLNEGTNFGYALCHRLLLLLMARLGRGCTIFSPEKHKALMDKYCSMGYDEVEYIVRNNYGTVDLMMEIMSLCSLEGHAQFLQRSWLRRILFYQKNRGCFGTEVRRTKMRTLLDGRGSHIKARFKNLSYDECNGHTTAVALGIFSAAIRYIVQEYY